MKLRFIDRAYRELSGFAQFSAGCFPRQQLVGFLLTPALTLSPTFSNINLTPLRLSLGSVSVRTRVLLSSTLSASSPAWLAAFCFEALAFSERSMLRKSFSSCWLAVALVNYNVVSNF